MEEQNKKICGAKTKTTGKPCQKPPMQGSNRCRLHGGATPKGRDSPHFKTGIYSKHIGNELQDIISDLEGMDTEELLETDAELRLMEALILRSKALKDGITDLKSLDMITRIIDRLVHCKVRSQKLKLQQERLIPVEDVKIFLNFTENILVRHTGHDEAFDIMQELKNFKISNQNKN